MASDGVTTPGRAVRIAALLVMVGLVGFGCRSSRRPPAFDAVSLAEAAEALSRPGTADMAALYGLATSSTGGMRLSVLQVGDSGRITFSDPFGAAVSMMDWDATGQSVLFDFREGCSVEGSQLSEVLGVAALPLPNAVRLLKGRLPAVEGDRVTPTEDGRLRVQGSGWSAMVTVLSDPWRVGLVEEETGPGVKGWRLRLKDHSGSVPGSIRVDGGDRGWAELELLRLQWDVANELTPPPALPRCDPMADEG